MKSFIIILDIVLAVSGFVGGRSLVKDPSGSGMHLSVKWLKQVPFIKDYLWPGMFLLVTYTYGGTLAAIATLKDYSWAQEFNMGLGLVLMAWIVTELILIPGKHLIQLLYFLLGLAIVILPLL